MGQREKPGQSQYGVPQLCDAGKKTGQISTVRTANICIRPTVLE